MNLPRSISVTRDKSFRNFNVPRSISVKRDRLAMTNVYFTRSISA